MGAFVTLPRFYLVFTHLHLPLIKEESDKGTHFEQLIMKMLKIMTFEMLHLIQSVDHSHLLPPKT